MSTTTTTTTVLDNIPIHHHPSVKCQHDRVETTTIHLKVTCLDDSVTTSTLSQNSNSPPRTNTDGLTSQAGCPASQFYDNTLSTFEKQGRFPNRRISIASSLTHDQFIEIISDIFSLQGTLDIFYKDYDRDDILLSTPLEFNEFLRFSYRDPTGTLKIAVRSRSSSENSSPERPDRKSNVDSTTHVERTAAQLRTTAIINEASKRMAAHQIEDTEDDQDDTPHEDDDDLNSNVDVDIDIPIDSSNEADGNMSIAPNGFEKRDGKRGSNSKPNVALTENPLGIPTSLLLSTVTYIATAFEAVMDSFLLEDYGMAQARARAVSIIVKDWKFVALCMKRFVEVASRKEVIYNALETVVEKVITWIHDNIIEESKPDAMSMDELIGFIEQCSALSHTEFLDDDIGEDDENDYDEEDGEENEEDDEDCDESGNISEINDGRNCRRMGKASASRTKPMVPVNDARYNLPILLAYAIRSALENETVLDVLRKLIHIWKSFSNVS